MTCDGSALEPMPQVGADAFSEFIQGLLKLPGGVKMVLDVAHLVDAPAR